MLSTTKYSALCSLGTEVLYGLCLSYGFLLSSRAKELHHSLFELLPGFVWEDPVRMIWGGMILGIFAAIGGWYIAWMHNTSLVGRK